MKIQIKCVMALTIALISIPVFAETIELRYKDFYSHVRKLSGEDTQALQFAFGFQHVSEARLCELTSAEIVTQKQRLPLAISAENRFTIQSERALNLADATVVLETSDSVEQCDMSVQLETKPEYLKQYYTSEELRFIFEQYAAFFNEMGSFLSFMMPQVDGLMLHFDDPELDHDIRDAPSIVNGMLQLRSDYWQGNKTLVLPEVPLRITARTDES
ncbi:DUF2987 domain-containing protein [Alteromonas sp. ASW11-36]|uniref:DUF2987 domain-containing protein n=1 Tax=Alteromonas arenosi TaxID=3055817 RepID=A0ABT7SXB8_9ALTE|nr:DUF2987 domain-containing protein [Alteromonas sp. ASW11-36]MDM7860823.1 DUF2987 domain-containing protein [Alteromonas sp. ASW11-36]